MSTGWALSLKGWSAWASGVETPAQWRDWAAGALAIGDPAQVPALAFIPALQRRRFSRLSRLQLQVAYDCAAGNHSLRTIFCSRHGELHRTHGLLVELARGEPLSPMAFSLSVHNTGSGLYSIASGNTAPSTAIAAGRDTLAMALLEAAGQLHAGAGEVMVVFADEPLPDDYAGFADEDTVPYGLALRLAPAQPGEAQLRLQRQAGSPAAGKAASAGLSLLRLLAAGQGHVTVPGERSCWQWSVEP